jgi:hypothetical protein
MLFSSYHHFHPGRWGFLSAVLLLMLAALACTTGSRPASFAPLSLAKLYAHCGLPASCGANAPWQGQTVTVQAFVDADNIFDKSRFPRLPYEKFRLVDRQGRSVEVWAQAADNRPIFAKLADRSSDRVTVTGRLAAVRLPVADQCRLGVKVLIDDASQIEFR